MYHSVITEWFSIEHAGHAQHWPFSIWNPVTRTKQPNILRKLHVFLFITDISKLCVFWVSCACDVSFFLSQHPKWCCLSPCWDEISQQLQWQSMVGKSGLTPKQVTPGVQSGQSQWVLYNLTSLITALNYSWIRQKNSDSVLNNAFVQQMCTAIGTLYTDEYHLLCAHY